MTSRRERLAYSAYSSSYGHKDMPSNITRERGLVATAVEV